MKKKSIKLNYIYNVTYQILLLLTPLITTPYISRVLGAEGIGSVSFAESIVSYFVLFASLGTSTLGQREISYVQADKKKRSNIFWNIVSLRAICTMICLLAYIVFFVTYGENTLMYAIMLINILAVMFDVTWFFHGIEEFGRIIGRNILFKITNILCIFIFVNSEDDVIGYVIILAVTTIGSNISLWLFLPKYVGKIYFKTLCLKHCAKEAIALFIPTVAIQVYTVLDKTMIGIFTDGSTENGYYEQAIRISKMVLTLVTSLGTVMIPRIGYYLGQNNQEKVRKYMYKGYNFVWFLGIPLCLGLIGVSDNMVPWFFGNGYDKVSILLKILSLLIVAIGISNVTGMQYLVPTKRQKLFTKTIVIGAIVNFILNLILIPYFFSIGAAVASIIAEIVISIVQLVSVRKELSIKTIGQRSVKYWIAGVSMLIILILENQFFAPNIINTFVMIVSGSIIYFLTLILLKDKFLINNIKNVIDKFRRINE